MGADLGVDDFLREYSGALERRDAALFAGAGLSLPAGLPGWGALLEGLARDIGLDVTKENDLVALAQFHVNRSAGSRAGLARLVRETFDRRVPIPDNQRILARLPIDRIWTTNYDEILERAWELGGKTLDVKSRKEDLVVSDPEADAVVYKMHGTASQPDHIVLTRDDYELYARRRGSFLKLLAGDLITRNFLFLGLSFTDPNLNHVLGTIRSSFRDMHRQHWTVMRRPGEGYAARRFDHFVTDLHRYGIRTLVIEEWDELTDILRRLEQRFSRKNVFVSGSFPDEVEGPERARVVALARRVGRMVAERGLNLVSGYGRVVGVSAVSGLVEGLKEMPAGAMRRRLLLHPVREVVPEGMTIDDYKRRTREDLINQAGIVIVVAGTKNGKAAPGVLQEFEMAAAQKKVVLPIASSGHAARQIWETIRAKPEVYLPPELDVGTLDALGPDTLELDAIAKALDACLKRIGV
jgi:hypothetical protein